MPHREGGRDFGTIQSSRAPMPSRRLAVLAATLVAACAAFHCPPTLNTLDIDAMGAQPNDAVTCERVQRAALPFEVLECVHSLPPLTHQCDYIKDAAGYYTLYPREGRQLASGTQPWPNWRGDNQRTGRAPVTANHAGVRMWASPRQIAQYSSSGAVSNDGLVIIGSGDSKLYAHNVTTGGVVWSFPTGGAIVSSPAISTAGVVYVGSYDGSVYAVDASTGAAVWQRTTLGQITSSPLVTASSVFVGSHDNHLYCMDAATGAVTWKTKTANWVTSSPALSNDGAMVYIGSYDYRVYAINAVTGAEAWNYTLSNGVHGGIAVGSDGSLYFGCLNGALYSLTSGGALRWSYGTQGQIVSSPALSVDGSRVYATSTDKRLYAASAANGVAAWAFTTGGLIHASPVVLSDNTIIIASTDNKVYAVTAAGVMRWSHDTGGLLFSTPAVTANATLVLGAPPHLIAIR